MNFTISGIIAQENGSLVPDAQYGIEIHQYHPDSGNLEKIAPEAGTESVAKGSYRLEIAEETFYKNKQGAIDIVVQLYDISGEKIFIQRSPLLKSIGSKQDVNLALSNNFQKLRLYDFVSQKATGSEASVITDSGDNPNIDFAKASEVALREDLSVKEVAQLARTQKIKEKLETSAGELQLDKAVTYALLDSTAGDDIPRLLISSRKELKEAVITAVENNDLDLGVGGSQLEQEIESKLDQFKEAAASVTASSEGSEIADFFSHAGLETNNEKKEFAKTLLNADPGDPESFWTSLGDTALSEKVSELRARSELKAICGSEEAANNLYTAFENFSILYEKSENDIKNALGQVDPPSNVQAFEGMDVLSSYARSITRKLELSDPTRFFAGRHKLYSSSQDGGLFSGLDNFFVSYPDFDLIRDNVKTYEFGEGLPVSETDLDNMQKLAQISPEVDRFESVKHLWNNGYRSSADIAGKGREHFVHIHENTLGKKTAGELHLRARERMAMSRAISSSFTPQLQSGFSFVPYRSFSSGDSTAGLPDLESIFGSLSACACRHCESILSPSAYLVDLLQWLKEVNIGGSDTLYTALEDRRPDLKHILLSCENTHNALPHIDLAIEILELAALEIYSPSAISQEDYKRQTSEATPVLQALPQYFKPEAYQALIKHVYPWQGIFHFWDSAAHIYLEHLGIPYEILVKDVPYHHGEAIKMVSDLDWASKVLQLNPLEKLIALFNTNAIENYTGLASVAITAFYDGTASSTLKGNMALLMEKAGLEWEELVELLDTKYVDGTLQYPAEGCDPADISLQAFSNDKAKRLLILRLIQNKQSQSVQEIDQIIQALFYENSNSITSQTLIDWAHILKIKEVTGLSVAEQLSWIAPLSTWSYSDKRSFYHSIFVDPSAIDPQSNLAGSTVEDLFALDSSGNELINTSTIYTNHDDLYAHILNACRLSSGDWESLMNHYGADADQNLSLANLSFLFASSSLCRNLGISVEELLLLIDITGIEPLSQAYHSGSVQTSTKANLSETKDFVGFYKTLEDWNISVKEVHFLLSDTEYADYTLEEEPVFELFSEIQDEFTSESFSNKLEGVVDPGGEVKNELKTSILVETLSDFLNSSSSLVRAILIQQEDTTSFPIPNSSDKLLDWLLSVDFEQDEANLSDGLKGLRYLNRALFFAEKMKWEAIDIPYLKINNSDLLPLHQLGSEYQLSFFPLLQQLFKASKFNGKYSGEERSPFGILYTSHKDEQDEATTITAMSNLTKWDDLEQLTSSDGFGFNDSNSDLNLGSNYHRETEWLLHLEQARKLARRADLKVVKLMDWVTAEMDQPRIDAIIQNIQSKYSEDKWFSVGPKLRDKLREMQRDALASYVAHRSSDLETNDLYGLYEYYLIDSEVNSCFMTSRTKQANSTIQLFVHRSLMGLEKYNSSPIEVPRNYRREWEWRKNYRVWEANRKVFLFPENWMEPELRDDQTKFFKEMMDELQQGDPDTETVNRAYLNYLSQVSKIAELEVAQTCYDNIEEENGIAQIPALHVFARSKNIPHTYYYRRWVDNLYWTEWEKVDLPIEDGYLMPIVYNNRLILLWASFLSKRIEPSEKARDNIIHVAAVADSDPEGHIDVVEVHLNWSEYYNDHWTEPKRAKETVIDYHDEFVGFLAAKVTAQNILEVYVYQDTWEYDAMEATGQTWSRLKGRSIASRHKWVFDTCDSEPRLISFWDDDPDEEATLRTGGALYDATDEQKWILKKNSHPLGVHVGLGSSFFAHHTDQYQYFDNFELKNKPYELSSDYVQLFENRLDRALRLTFTHEAETSAGFYDRGKNHFFVEDRENTFFVKPLRKVNNLQEETHLQLLNMARQSLGGLQIGMVLRNTPFASVGVSPGLQNSSSNSSNFFTPGDQGSINALTGSGRTQLNTDPPVAVGTLEMAPPVLSYNYRFYPFYHRYICLFKKQVSRYGVEGLLNPRPGRSQQDDMLELQQVTELFFKDQYQPTANVIGHDDPNEKYLPKNEIDFELHSSYGIYNWEVFYHAPMHIANELAKNQKFAEAQKWYHYIFDPTETEGGKPERYWRFKPFNDLAASDSVSLLEESLSGENDQLQATVNVWRKNPFMPYAIARMRLESFMMNTVMKYLDNLIAWGDKLFARDTMESLNEATQIYALAGQILGRRPVEIEKDLFSPDSYEELGDFDVFSNAEKEIESVMKLRGSWKPSHQVDQEIPMDTLSTNYFCIPKNDKLWTYWDTIADRLFKIRNCLNIEGVFRQLPLFEPPIDPALLVKAAAAGVSIGDALNMLNAPAPHYRYNFLHQKARDLVNDVKSLGNTLLSVLEKKDAEELSQLRSRHEVNVAERMIDIRKKGLEEAGAQIESLQESKAIAQHRQQYYSSRPYMNTKEKAQIGLMSATVMPDTIAGIMKLVGSVLTPIPKIEAVATLTPGVNTEIVDGAKIGQVLNLYADMLQIQSSMMKHGANMIGTLGGYDRRQDDWDFQAEAAEKEIEQIDKQIIAAKIREAMAQKEVKHQQQIQKEADEALSFMQDKFTNDKLYGWMVKEVSKLYFNAYQMAFDMAKKAEKAHFREVEIENAQSKQYIEFGHWDSLKKGLLAGDRLHQDLKRLDAAHVDKNERLNEITKQVSLAVLDPQALVKLREQGFAEFDVPELWYDLDYPGHYQRRIKSVSLTIPCVSGAYNTVNAKLTLQDHFIRLNTDNSTDETDYPRDGAADPRFRSVTGAAESYAMSGAQNETGAFELNFNDPRYLPFEGAGAISNWRLELPHNKDASGSDLAGTENFPAFDYSTISDAIITIRYFAKEDAGTFKEAALKTVTANINKALDETAASGDGLWRVFSLKREFPTEYHRFLTEPVSSGLHSAELELQEKHFPHIFKGKTLKTGEAAILLVPKEGVVSGLASNSAVLKFENSGSYTAFGSGVKTDEDPNWGGIGSIAFTHTDKEVAKPWKIEMDESNNGTTTIDGENLFSGSEIQKDLLDDILIAIRYKKDNS